MVLCEKNILRKPIRKGLGFRWKSKTVKIGFCHATARSENSSGKSSVQEIHSDVVSARTPTILISKSRVNKRVFFLIVLNDIRIRLEKRIGWTQYFIRKNLVFFLRTMGDC